MKCSECGAKIAGTAKFCPECGGKVPNQKNKFPRWLVVILLLVILIAVSMIVLFQKRSVSPVSNGQETENESKINESETNKSKTNESFDVGTVYELKEDKIVFDKEMDIHYVNNIVILFFTDAAGEDQIAQVISSIDGKVVGSIPILKQYQVEIPEKTCPELVALCNQLEESDLVLSASIDQAFQLKEEVIPNDPWGKEEYTEEWQEEHPDGANWWMEAINAPTAWEYCEEMQPVKIGIMDNGFDTEHEDLQGKIKRISENNNIEAHGTHVAGIIGATANNECGMTGIVWNSELYTRDWLLTDSQRVNEQYSTWNTTTQILTGVVDLIVTDGAKVVNLSAGCSGSMLGTSRYMNNIDMEGEQVSAYLLKMLDLGYDFLIVQSAGNGNAQGAPVDAVYNGLFCTVSETNSLSSDKTSAKEIVDRIVVVAAAERAEENTYCITDFSNYGDRIDVCAPGRDIYSTVPGGYISLSGTSMAAPIVTGVAALVWASDETLSGADVKKIVCDKAHMKYEVQHPYSDQGNYRLVNAARAVEAVWESEADYELFYAYSLLPKYGIVKTGSYQVKEEWDESHGTGSSYRFLEKTSGILWHAVLDVNQDKKNELAIIRLEEGIDNYNLVLEVYGTKKREIVLKDSYVYETVFRGDQMTIDILLMESDDYCYWGILEQEEHFVHVDGGRRYLTIIDYSSNDTLQVVCEDNSSTYSLYSSDPFRFSLACRNLGMQNSADCASFVSEDGIRQIYKIEADIGWGNTDGIMDTSLQGEGFDLINEKKDYYVNGVFVSIVNEETLLKWYEQEDNAMNDCIIRSIYRAFQNMWPEGEYHIIPDEESFSVSKESISFTGCVEESGEAVLVALVRVGEYNYCVSINDEKYNQLDGEIWWEYFD